MGKDHKLSKANVISVEAVLKDLQEQFPDLSLSELKEIVESPFASMKEDLKKDNLYIYRFQNFGTFYCSVKRAKYYLNSVENNVKSGKVSEERGEEIKKMLDEFIERKS